MTRSIRLLVLALAAVAVAGTIASLAFRGPSAFAYRSLWPADVPGKPSPLPRLARDAASRTGVDPSSLRVVTSIGNAGMSYSLVAGADAGRRPCFSVVGGSATLGFECLGRSSTRDGSALVYYTIASGGTFRTVDHAVIVGIARADVARVAVTGSGVLRELPLNEWRGFAYTATEPDTLPVSLLAYGASGKIVERVDVHPTPLCGGAAGDCPA
jgi:hypothetical protein